MSAFSDLLDSGLFNDIVKAGSSVGTAAVSGKYNAQTAAALGMYGAAGGGGVTGGVSPIVIQTGGAAAPAPQDKTQSAGMPAWGWVVIAVGAAGLLVGVYFMSRKKA